MQKAIHYNKMRLARGELTWEDLVELIKLAQKQLGLDEDGFAGPKTIRGVDTVRAINHAVEDTVWNHAIAELEPLMISDQGWLSGASLMPSHKSWYYHGPEIAPKAVVAHYTSTDPNTAESMARRRMKHWDDYAKWERRAGRKPRKASWHVTIEKDGGIFQMVPFTRGAWHARETTTAINLLGATPNRCSIGIEMVGHGDEYPREQVLSAARVWRAVCTHYGIKRELAMVGHSELDPGRKQDPGPIWDKHHAARVVAFAYSD